MAQDDVSYIPFQDDLDNSSSPILQSGNYFIMDEEAVRSNPLLEFRQRDSLRQQPQKRRSSTDRMACVRNNIRENYFVKTTSGLEHQKSQTLQKLHESCSKLRHEVKILDMDRLRHEVEVKKRLQPDTDYSCEDVRLENMARRLDTGTTSCYLDKKMKYPTRNRSLRDTPTVKKARASLLLHELRKSLKETTETRSSYIQSVKPSSNQWPTISRTLSTKKIQSLLVSENAHLFNMKQNCTLSLPTVCRPAGLVVNHRQYTSGQDEELEYPPEMKSSGFQNARKVTASADKKMTTLPSFLSDQLNYSSISCDSSDDDHAHLPEPVDLKAYFLSGRQNTNGVKPTFSSYKNTNGDKPTLSSPKNINGDKPARSSSKNTNGYKPVRSSPKNINGDNSARSSSNNPRETPYLMLLRKPNETPRKLLAGTINNEVRRINSKVVEFLKNFPTSKCRDRNYKVNNLQNYSKSQITEENVIKPAEVEPNISTAPYSNIDPAVLHPHCHLIDTDDQTEHKRVHLENNEMTALAGTPSRYSWKLIKGGPAEGRERGACTVNDLVLQTLTGIPICNILGSHVPLHAASRAMRHTATFKMHKIMEKLANERTRYQKYEMGELKKVMDEKDYMEPT